MPETLTLDVHTLTLYALRWIHFLAGIIWIGHLYFFNFVNGPFAKTLDADAKKKVVPQLMPRALWWFRWSAMITVLSGLAYIFWKLFVATSAGFTGTGGLFNSTWGYWISFGGALGIVMWFNVWFIIWPNQKKIIAAVSSGQKPDDGAVKTAYLASRTNVYLSGPMLFGMAGASHFPSFSMGTLLGATAVGLAVIWVLIKVSATAGAKAPTG